MCVTSHTGHGNLPTPNPNTVLNNAREKPVPDTITFTNFSERHLTIGWRTGHSILPSVSVKAPMYCSRATWALSNT